MKRITRSTKPKVKSWRTAKAFSVDFTTIYMRKINQRLPISGGRYIYYAGRDAETRYYNNCFLLKAEEDMRQDWAKLA